MKSHLQKDEDESTKGMITTVGNNTEPVPLDLVIEILTRLPAKSVLKFRCVSKQWCSIIESRSFINSFMSLSPPRLSLSYCIRHPTNDNMSFYFSSSSPPHQESNHSSSSSSTISLLPGFNSVRGIILTSLNHPYFAIWNPTTRQVIRLSSGRSKSDEKCYMFLGYNPSNDQYKILRITGNKEGFIEHSVCTLEKSRQSCFSSWRHVENHVLYSYVYNSNVVCINGVLYYGALSGIWNPFMVVSFDVGSERLRLIQGPNNEKRYFPLVNYHGKLACCSIDLDGKRFRLFVLNDAKEPIWSTKTFSPPWFYFYASYMTMMSVCGMTDAGEIVFASKFIETDDVETLHYDLKKNNVRREVLRLGESKVYDEFRFPPDHYGFNCSSSDLYRSVSISCDHVDNITLF